MGRRWFHAFPCVLPVAETVSQGSCAVMQPGIFNETEEEMVGLR
jgi:hypothetical protein